MIKNIIKTDIKGFTLLEMTIVIILLTTVLTALAPSLTRDFLNKAAQKTSLDINAIQNAALAYYVKNNSWPTSIIPTGTLPATDLETTGFLPAGWNATNPFGNVYTASINGSDFTVSTLVMNGSQVFITNQLPTSSYSGATVSSSVPPPGDTTQSLYYDSGWFPVTHGQIYTLTHNLNSINLMVQIWFATDSKGSNMQGVQSQVHVNKSDYGAVIQNVSSTTISISTSNGYVANDNNWPGISQYSSGYYRVLIRVLY